MGPRSQQAEVPPHAEQEQRDRQGDADAELPLLFGDLPRSGVCLGVFQMIARSTAAAISSSETVTGSKRTVARSDA
jgi:hypothetical protein